MYKNCRIAYLIWFRCLWIANTNSRRYRQHTGRETLHSRIFNMYLHFAKVKHTMKKTNSQNSRLYPTSINIRLDPTFFSIWRLKWSTESPAIRERDKQEHTIATPGNRIQATEPIGTYSICKDALAWLPSDVKHKYIMRTGKKIFINGGKYIPVFPFLQSSEYHTERGRTQRTATKWTLQDVRCTLQQDYRDSTESD